MLTARNPKGKGIFQMKESKKTDVLLMFVALLLGTLGAVMMCLASTAAAQGMWSLVALLSLAVFSLCFDRQGRHA